MEVFAQRSSTNTPATKPFMLAFWMECSIIHAMATFSQIIQTSKEILSHRILWKILLGISLLLLVSAWLWNTPAGLMGKADAIGYAVCHRIDVRSFHLGDRQIPVCARCTGQYLGAMLGLVYLTLLGKRRVGRPPWGVIAILVTFAGFYAVDGFNSYLHLIPGTSRFYLYEPNNTLRLLTGTGLGLGMSVGLLPAFYQTVWRTWDPAPCLNYRSFTGLLVLALLVDFLVLTENPLILYPLALISAAGILVLLTMVYTMVWLLVFKADNQFERLSQLLVPLLAGFMVALLQIAALDFFRYLLTGTWGGFHLG
jgi:uncharacterized membrane protein